MQNKSFGSYIRALRTQNELTQAGLAKKLHVTDKAVSKWERDLSYPDISLFPKLADVLGVTVGDLLKECTAEDQPSRLMQIFEMSHDIRTPLHIILGCADMARIYRDDPELLDRYLASIHISGQYLLNMIEKVMESAEPGAGRPSEIKYPSNITELGDYLKNYEKEEHALPEPFDFSGKRILVAEDIDLNREIARELLLQTGAEVELAENGQVCIEMLSRAPAGHYDLILMDLRMPIMDGFEATRRIRRMEDPKKASIPIVALSANVYEKDRSEAAAAGIDDFEDKPIFLDKLLATMNKYL